MNATDKFQQYRKAAYEAGCLIENLWQDELDRVYGKDAVNARYDTKRNAATPMLKALYDMRKMQLDAWALAGKLDRNEIAAS